MEIWKKFFPLFPVFVIYTVVVLAVYFISPEEHRFSNVSVVIFALAMALYARILTLTRGDELQKEEYTFTNKQKKLARLCRFFGTTIVAVGVVCLIVFSFVFTLPPNELWILQTFVGAIVFGGFLVICGRTVLRYSSDNN